MVNVPIRAASTKYQVLNAAYTVHATHVRSSYQHLLVWRNYEIECIKFQQNVRLPFGVPTRILGDRQRRANVRCDGRILMFYFLISSFFPFVRSFVRSRFVYFCYLVWLAASRYAPAIVHIIVIGVCLPMMINQPQKYVQKEEKEENVCRR